MNEMIKEAAKILSKDVESLKFLAHSYLFMDSLSNEYDELRKKNPKERRKVIAKKWVLFKKEKGVEFDQVMDKDLVDSATKILGTEEKEE